MRLPNGFAEDYQAMRTRLHWAVQRGEEIDMQHARLTTQEVSGFLRRWDGKIAVREIQVELTKVHAWVLQMERHLGKLFLVHLLEVLEARKEWQVAELFLKASTAFIGIMKQAPAGLLPQLEAIYRAQMGCDFEPTLEFRQSESEAEAGESNYRKALREFETDWTDCLTPDLRQKLARCDAAQTRLWIAELQVNVEAFDVETEPVIKRIRRG